ncbi:unnamed protein product [Acanthoscelides obtectus]|uniref:Alpha/beta hydrolase fold-3 domain-containing protein n=1 Tax=Acanthoscelides obtectus TaxID=200917 RepID=A0A9P0P6J0_ACAOB|nr:unnamed protein product [Acanthoscelides obtectus]CAK1653239.1 Kynurenine formamidase [Acanthoscelides obtectus]
MSVNIYSDMSGPETDPTTFYSPSAYSKRYPRDQIFEKHLEIVGKLNKEVQGIKSDLYKPYGKGKREVYHIYGTDLVDSAPIFIFIHGGYWQEAQVTHDTYVFIAKNLHKQNVKTILIGYELCPAVTVEQIQKNVEGALKICLEYAKNLESRSVHLAGHSAGGQLVANLLESFVPSLPEEERKLIRTAFLLAGIYDIIPLTKTEYNEPLKLDEQSAKKVSPMFKKFPKCDVKVYVIVAENDSPPFLTQGKQFHEHLIQQGLNSEHILLKNIDHFDLMENLDNEEFEISKLITKCVTES